MRRCSAALSVLSVGLLLTVASGAVAVPASADDTPTTTASASAAAPTDTDIPTTPGASTAAAKPVDLSLSTSFGNDPAATPRGTQRGLTFSVSGVSRGATLALTLPAALSVVSAQNDGVAISCAPAAVVPVCDLGALDGIALVSVVVQVAGSTPIGTQLHVDAVVAPTRGSDSNPADNAAGIDLTVVGRADVTQSQSVQQVDVPLGGSAPFTLTLRNAGPDPATGVLVGFTVQSNDDPRPTLSAFSSPDVAPKNGGYEWTAGTIPAGGSVSLTVTISASSPAVDSALSYSTSYDGVGQVCEGTPACLFGAPVRTFVPASTTPTPTPTSVGPELAATGSDDGPLALVAVSLLVGGVGLTVLGRRRRLG